MAFLNRNCLACGVGSVIARWQNVSMTRPIGDTPGPHYTVPPYPRFDQSNYDAENPGAGCATLPAGTCGTWLQGGDLNGVSEQEIQDTVDDIMACNPLTQVVTDHNCYVETTGTVDMRASKLFGGQWILAKKNWHGTFGWNSNDACAQNPNIAADQTKYLTVTVAASLLMTVPEEGGPIVTTTSTAAGSVNVNAQSGIITHNLWTTMDQTTAIPGGDSSHTPSLHLAGTAGTVTGWTENDDGSWEELTQTFLQGDGQAPPTWMDNYCTADVHCGIISTPAQFNTNSISVTPMGGQTLQSVVAIFNAAVATNGGTALPAITDPMNYSGSGHISYAGGSSQALALSWSTSATVFTWSYDETDPGGSAAGENKFTGTLTLSNPYTAAACYADFLNALAAWDMSDLNLAGFRADEELAFAPLCLFDEVGPVTPLTGFLPPTMNNLNGTLQNDANGNAPGSTTSTTGQHDIYGHGPTDPDYNGPVNYVITYPQMTWMDPNNYIWRYPNGSCSQPSGFTGGATLLTPMRTGAIISHTQAGSDRHFWYNYVRKERLTTDEGFEWFNDTWGDYSQPPLPNVSMRWMDNQEAQYDATAYRGETPPPPPPGNYPQGWVSEYGSVVRGGKFVCASQTWPAVNFGRPCGADKYAVDQTTVCCVASTGSSGTQFLITVNATETASAPLAAGGLQPGDYIILEGTGIFQIASISGSLGPWTLNCTTLAAIDGIPTGFSFSTESDGSAHVGRLRFPTAPGICGRAAITTASAGSTVTITPAIAQPWLRAGATGSILVDIYDASMTLLVSGAALTRVSDTSFTFTSAAIPTAAWMTGHGVDYTQYSSASQKTGVHLDWTFNQRAAASGYTTPPTWYGGITGCLACTVTQFNYSGACPAPVGIVPWYDGDPVEHFTNQVMFAFPSGITFDDVFGAHWQAAVMLSMPDPFWQTPFTPSCGGDVIWLEDDGTCNKDSTGISPPQQYYAHHPLVEALSSIPSGKSLPAGVTLLYDPAHNVIAPPYYPNGIPIGDGSGDYGSIATDWGFAANACACMASSGRFSAIYATFVTC